MTLFFYKVRDVFPFITIELVCGSRSNSKSDKVKKNKVNKVNKKTRLVKKRVFFIIR